jgi:CheY-like chemotaxis protein
VSSGSSDHEHCNALTVNFLNAQPAPRGGDLVLLDIMMPNVNGYEVLAA